jgi:hypothetical protein
MIWWFILYWPIMGALLLLGSLAGSDTRRIRKSAAGRTLPLAAPSLRCLVSPSFLPLDQLSSATKMSQSFVYSKGSSVLDLHRTVLRRSCEVQLRP